MYDPPGITVAVGAFEDLLARGLRSLIDGDDSLEAVALDVSRGRLMSLLRARTPDVAIIDFASLGSPVEVRELAEASPGTRLVVLADEPTDVESAQLLALGASACLTKSTQARDILNAIHQSARGMRLSSRERAGAAAADGPLTQRESDVLLLLQHRRSNAQIAVELNISVETVRTHARNIYRKLGVASRRELLAPAPPQAPRAAPDVAASRRLRVVNFS